MNVCIGLRTFRASRLLLWLTLFGFGFCWTIVAQDHQPDSSSPTRMSADIESALQPLAENVADSIVQIINDHDRTILGTIVSREGLIVTKHSELSKKFQCVLSDGRQYPGRLIAIYPANDLALVKVDAQKNADVGPPVLTPIVFATLLPVEQGQLLVTPSREATVAAFGITTVAPQRLIIEQPQCRDCIDLGAVVSRVRVLSDTAVDTAWLTGPPSDLSGLKVSRVYPRTASEQSGLLVGDLLQAINGIQCSTRADLNAVAATVRVGQTLTLGILRGGQPLQLVTNIESLAPKTLHDRWGGGPFSERRFGFRTVIAHDSVVAPQQCGGPLLDLKGNVVGINIARSMRVATFAIPIEEVEYFVTYADPTWKPETR